MSQGSSPYSSKSIWHLLDLQSYIIKIVTSTHVNLIDLIDGGDVRTFQTVVELSKYTKRQKKFFPRNNANAGNLLKYLLRHIARPSLDIGRFDGSEKNITLESKAGKKNGRRRRSAKDDILRLWLSSSN